ncbi:VanZ family protein [Streptococcus dentasini]
MTKILERLFDGEAEVTDLGYKLTCFLLTGYGLCLIYLCFAPQPFEMTGVETPNIHYLGRIPVLLVPFNSFISIGQLDTLKELFWIMGQNFSNLFLLTPVLLGLLALFKRWRRWRLVLVMSFLMSLFIESTQILLDLLFNFNRVFEIDDLIFNTLGGLVALWLLPVLQFIVVKILLRKKK